MEEAHNCPGGINIFLKYLLLVIPFLGLAWLLQKAAALLRNDSGMAALPGVIQGMIWFALVFLIVQAVEKKRFHWADFGLSRGACKPALLFLGTFLGMLLYNTILNSLPVIFGTHITPVSGLAVHSAAVLILFLILMYVLGLERKKNASLDS